MLESPPSASDGHSWMGLRWGSQGKSRSPGQGEAACGRVTGLCSKSARASLGSAHHSCHGALGSALRSLVATVPGAKPKQDQDARAHGTAS